MAPARWAEKILCYEEIGIRHLCPPLTVGGKILSFLTLVLLLYPKGIYRVAARYSPEFLIFILSSLVFFIMFAYSCPDCINCNKKLTQSAGFRVSDIVPDISKWPPRFRISEAQPINICSSPGLGRPSRETISSPRISPG